MANTMYFKGESNLAFGVVVTEYPAIPAPKERGDWADILGREGQVWQGEDVYDEATISVTIWVRSTANIALVRKWLSGAGMLRFGTWNWQMSARISAASNFSPADFNDGWNATITFSVHPAWYKYPVAAAITVPASGTAIPNRGLVASKPLITVVGSGNIDLQIGDRTIHITGLSGLIDIDCESLTSSIPTSVSIEDDLWPTLTTPTCTISWTGTVTSVTVLPRWRLA